MSEGRWMACEDPTPMLEFTRDKVSSRKLRLFCCAFIRRHWSLLINAESRAAVDHAEQHAHLRFIPLASYLPFHTPKDCGSYEQRHAESVAWQVATIRNFCTDHALAIAEEVALIAPDVFIERAAQAALYRCVIGSPIRSVTILPEWRTATVLALAEAMYESSDFSAMPILADALQDANCTDEAILTHCRGTGPHFCGCWVIDALTGRA